MKLKLTKLVDNISGLQIYQLSRFTVFLIISIVFTKSHLSSAEIGKWEMFLFIAGMLSFFWVTGVIQALLPLYHRNRTYRKMGDTGTGKSPEIFNAFLLLTFFSLLTFVLGHSVKGSISVFHFSGNVPFINLLLLYILLSSPVCLIEYIYLLNNRSHRIIIVRWIWLIILLKRYTRPEFSWKFMKEHLYLGAPLIITSLISGSAQYIDGVIISSVYRDPAMFAWFRYGAKEFPLVLLLANGLSNAMLPEFATRAKMKESLAKLKIKSKRLMHLLFPITMVIMLFTRWFYPRLFAPEFHKSAGVFLVYTLLIVPRLVFPQTIVIGRKKTRIALIAAIIEIGLNIPLSLLMIKWGYGIVGVALATFVVYCIAKIFLTSYVWIKMKIKPTEYIPLKIFLIYSVLTAVVFILVDRRIIDIR
ncbi:MAG: hypothetical protein H6Q23_524 [Bacteroidetes bacterium]|nr:hypothetical protein [Bacteroidota bacterium]